MFKLPITIAFQDQIDSMKTDLTKSYPDIKSSHRVEALARALGFKTYASLRARDLFYDPIETEVDWVSFYGYLKERGFNPSSKPLYISAGRAIIKLILEVPNLEPNLTYEGIGVNTEYHKGETVQKYRQRFFQSKKDLLSDSAVEEFIRSYILVSRIPKTRTITKNRGAYSIKHIAEKMEFSYPDGECSKPKYVGMGALICASLHSGFRYKSYPNSQNVHFNMLQKSIDNLDYEIRPHDMKERKSVSVSEIVPLHYTKRTVEPFVIGDKAWISWGGKKALPVEIINVDDRHYTVSIEHPKKYVGKQHVLYLDEVRSTPELACLNYVAS